MKYLPFALLFIATFPATAQNNAAYLKTNAIRVSDPYQLNDSIYNTLSPFKLIMMGEMHGTREPAQFVTGLAKLLTSKGDSVCVGLEIPSSEMADFNVSHTDSSIYQSSFFSNFSVLDGRESFAWASVISHLKNDPRVQLFFFDVVGDEEKKYDRDSIMYLKIKKQMQLHPGWKTVTLTGNKHNRLSPGEKVAAYFLRQDKELNLSTKICAINHYYQQGTCNANFGHGIENRPIGHPINTFDTTLAFDKYFLMMSPKSNYPYTALYYTRNVSPSEMVKNNFDLNGLKNQLKTIYKRDQKTRKGEDSAAFMSYIDSTNLVQIRAIVDKYGWLGTSCVGNTYNQALFLVIQHANLAAQEEYFPLIQQSVEEGESNAAELAMLQDRILMRQGKKQLFGSQIILNNKGGQELYPIEDEKRVNIRRQKVGLQPLEEYAKYFGIDYKLPSQ